MKHLNVVPSGHIQSLGIVKVPAYKGTTSQCCAFGAYTKFGHC